MHARFPDNFSESAEEPDGKESPALLLNWLEQQTPASCAGCSKPLCGHELLHSRAGAGAVPPRCTSCLAVSLRLDSATLRQNLDAYIRRRDCYRAAWEQVSADEPACPFVGTAEKQTLAAVGARLDTEPTHHSDWDAGDLGCGDLLLPLRGKMRALSPGEILKLTARDPSAPEDIPAWCGVTGHQLIHAAHPAYWIRRRDD
jgi:tRNA 2-thiouridine synthesizing protein A